MVTTVVACSVVLAGCAHAAGSGPAGRTEAAASSTVTLRGQVESGIVPTHDPSQCTGYALHVVIESASGQALGVGMASAWRLMPLHGMFSCRAAYKVTVHPQRLYTVHADDPGFTDMTVDATQIADGQLPVLSGHLT